MIVYVCERVTDEEAERETRVGALGLCFDCGAWVRPPARTFSPLLATERLTCTACAAEFGTDGGAR